MEKAVLERIRAIVEDAEARGGEALLETDGLRILETLGFDVPEHVFIRDAAEVRSADLSSLGGDRVVVKAISPQILHKTDVGGVVVVSAAATEIERAVKEMSERLAGRGLIGFTINRFVDYEPSFGNELLLSMRWTNDFGPVVVFGAGGIYTEAFTRHFKPGRDLAVFSPIVLPLSGIGSELTRVAVTQLITWKLRGRAPRIPLERLVSACKRLCDLATSTAPALLTEMEINPLIIRGDSLCALDVLVKRGTGEPVSTSNRPLHKMQSLLEPRNIAIVGVSEKTSNPGRVILNNCLRDGFDRSKLFVVKPGCREIDGCRCVPDIASLPGTVDLIVLSIRAEQIPSAINSVITDEKAESVIVIPGGLEEKDGVNESVRTLYDSIRQSRRTAWEGPLINGGNSLGVRSHPGRYDTIFIPRYKLGRRGGGGKVAFVSQSGAFAIAQGSKLSSVGFRYTISIGNQMDLTLGDYLEYLAHDEEVDIFAVYMEGFKPADGIRFLQTAREITSTGRTVILYCAGRSAAGARAMASHTASIAGNYTITKTLATGVGVIVAETIEDFEDLVMLFDMLRGRKVDGLRLGTLSNAGFECVNVADNLGGFCLEPFTPSTTIKIRDIFAAKGIDNIVDIHNPLDVTPMLDDAEYEAAVRAVLSDDNVGVGLIGCVPFTSALNTLEPGPDHQEDLHSKTSVAQRLIAMRDEFAKPWVAVVDGGPPFITMRRMLLENGIPTFKTTDRALRLLGVYCESRLRESR